MHRPMTRCERAFPVASALVGLWPLSWSVPLRIDRVIGKVDYPWVYRRVLAVSRNHRSTAGRPNRELRAISDSEAE